VLDGVDCGIYKSSYNVSNISYLNSLPLHHKPFKCNAQANTNGEIYLVNIWGRKKTHGFLLLLLKCFPAPHFLKKKRGAGMGIEERKGEK
jgi:hypothetical protein